MNHLQSHVMTGFIPRALKNKAGREIDTVTDQNNVSHFVRLVTYLPAQLLSEIRYHSPALLTGLGKLLGEIDRGLDGFSHPAMSRELKWDLQHALWIKDCTHHIADPGRRAIVERIVLPDTVRPHDFAFTKDGKYAFLSSRTYGDDSTLNIMDMKSHNLVGKVSLCAACHKAAGVEVKIDKGSPLLCGIEIDWHK